MLGGEFQTPEEAIGPEEMRKWLLGAAIAEMNLLAAIADKGEGLEDLRFSFRYAASVWAEQAQKTLSSPHLRPVEDL